MCGRIAKAIRGNIAADGAEPSETIANLAFELWAEITGGEMLSSGLIADEQFLLMLDMKESG